MQRKKHIKYIKALIEFKTSVEIEIIINEINAELTE